MLEAAVVQAQVRREFVDLCSKRTPSFEKGPLLWLTHPYMGTKTENPKYIEQGLPFRAPFPTKTYFIPVLNWMLTKPRLFIPKTREMLTSWLGMGFATWLCGWRPGSFVVVQADKEKKAMSLVNYARVLWQNQPEWMRDRWPLTGDAKEELIWANGSTLIGVPSGEAQIRHYHPTLYILDEMAFLPEAEQCYNVANPVAQQIIGISSAGPGFFGQECAMPTAMQV